MPLSEIRRGLDRSRISLLSTDVFDTLVLRDGTNEAARLATAARRAAAECGADPEMLVRLRWWMQRDAYRAVAVGEPTADARLSDICAAVAAAAGLDDTAADVIRRAEVDTDIRHLRPHRGLIDLVNDCSRDGIRVIAVSDTYYSADDVERLLTAVLGANPVAKIYTSADLGATKHSGAAYARVAQAEGVSPESIAHLGDNVEVDVRQARRASWTAFHVVSEPERRAAKTVRRLRGIREKAGSVR